eukprot:TRINITY_DN79480_c0_g1_i1.p1 TRINITY_DN79480_c0_g1~~TRINITY_DN79480_c0_g1_i1.p1  ORF type:complete len:311 (-),score=40.81 TRINITY_DN79480_c0_g1_i1:52-984(-)
MSIFRNKSHPTRLPTKAAQLKAMLTSDEVEFMMEAHSGLCAKIVEETGFKAIWGSGLSISAGTGVRDTNELSFDDVLHVVEQMSDATDIPILLDGDTGYGNFNNARRLVRKLEQKGIAGVCIEDKVFPKVNSLLNNVKQPLAEPEEFAGKIRAMKDMQAEPNFCVVARVEALIAGWGIEEALKRAEIYKNAGADAILIHSKQKDGKEIIEFLKQWNGRHPVVIVPTTYPDIPLDTWKELKVSLIIWANHNLRASVTALQKCSKQLFEEKSAVNVLKEIVPVTEIFRLQDQQEFAEAEKKYLPQTEAKKEG